MSLRIAKIAQLDPLRALAALLVMLQHFLPEFGIGRLPMAWVGVDLFFVISGFLITAILLKQKEAMDNRTLIIKNFMIKRALRLFPAYYALITLFAILQYKTGLWSWDQGHGIYYYTYTANFLFFFEGFRSAHLNHLWTLAVEEQFYLIWPWLVLFLSKRWLSWSLGIMAILSLASKSFLDWDSIRMLTSSHFDTLGCGALIAIHRSSTQRTLLLLQRNAGRFILAALIGFVICHAGFGNYALASLSVLVFSVSIVAGCIEGFTGWFGWILDRPWLARLGGISYGLYLYHMMMPVLARIGLDKLGWEVDPYVLFMLSVALTIAIAELSFRYLESPFLKLKHRFDL